MRNRRYRILAGTALALILAAPLVGMAKNNSQIAAVPMAAPPAEQALPETAPATATPANEAPAVSNGAVPDAATSVEQTAAPDPLASLDPADRAVAENIRDLLATRADKLFAGKKERAAVEAFYQNRNFAPLWLEKGARERACRIGHRPPEGCRCRRPRARRIPDAEFRRPGDPMRWPRPSSGSRASCSPMRATCRPGVFPIPA